jgi:hypothetical protein
MGTMMHRQGGDPKAILREIVFQSVQVSHRRMVMYSLEPIL